MHRFWETNIRPILTGMNIKKLVEIGAHSGANTVKLLEYCRETNGKLFVIDPKPLFDANTLTSQYGSELYLIKNLSLNVLPFLTDYDAVLLDGDHNWYTVYHELKMIEQNAINRGKFPLVFVHDIEWPYARRDLYYSPESIPEPFRKPYAKKGMLPGLSELIENDGVNFVLNNALYEGGERNGVLTAVEDFLKETELPISFYQVSGSNGLGILVPSDISMDEYITF
ncbi:class I SAM-dependent methyltransferase [Peribacillus simplex]|uniref:Family 2 glycosyl transferase n=2 Tax=Peribacillus simplex TaxID=1478 RepID=A0A223ENF3_9BACI|nr:class I SAM-dependent methyltransferase [Peribacillus simplex]ASS96790.1 family 2 glycosyl transferase [Peribacillus simplex NBRC 15720 = DSM 1321]MEC1395793.1 class I SAM-dependent methyltransferase [Peribacillus simplex]